MCLAVAPACAQNITHVPLFTFHGDSVGDQFGFSVSGAGDVNGDGFGDLIVGAPGDTDSGRVRVFSGVDGSVLYNFVGDSVGDDFGYSVSGAGSGTDLFLFNRERGPGDINGDGIDDLLVGAPRDDKNGEDTGSVRGFSGSDVSVLYTINGDPTEFSSYRLFGTTLNGGRDASGDGLIDTLVVGATSNGARVHLVTLSGAISPPVIFENQGDGITGRNSDSVGDVNGDGRE